MKMRHCGSRNIILIWNIYLTILIPFVVLLSGIWHLESGVRHGKAAGLPIAVILAFLPLVLFGLKWKMDSTFTIIASCVWFIFMWKMAYYFFYDKTNSPIVYTNLWRNIFWNIGKINGWFHVRRIIKKTKY